MNNRRRACLSVIAFALGACAEQELPTPVFHEEENPPLLSEWGMFEKRNTRLVLAERITPYDLTTPLFSDYALKLRTMWLPEGQTAFVGAEGQLNLPVGSVLTKTFYYRIADGKNFNAVLIGDIAPYDDHGVNLDGYRPIETRVLARRQEGWVALPYIWNDDLTDADLKRAGDIIPLTLHRSEEHSEDIAYQVPNANQCAACHATNATTKAIEPIGLNLRHLMKRSTFQPDLNQINSWIAEGRINGDFSDLTISPNVNWRDPSKPIDLRARAYLDINCSHCHNPDGAADTSGLNLEPDAVGPALGICKSPIAAGSGSGGRPYDIVPGSPEKSITVFRLETTDPGAMMPELGRSVVHEEGVALITEWIAKMEGACS